MNAMNHVDAVNAAPPPRARSGWGWLRRGALLLAGALVLLTLVLTVVTVALGLAAPQFWQEISQHVHVNIDGERIALGPVGANQGLAVAALVTGALLLALLIVCTVVPMALLVAGGALLFGLGVALLALLGTAALVLSPLLLIVGLVWLMWLLWRLVKG